MYYTKTVYCCSFCHSNFDKVSQAEECDSLGSPAKLEEVVVGDEILVSTETYHPSNGMSINDVTGKVIYKTVMLNVAEQKKEHIYYLLVKMKNELGKVVCERGVVHAVNAYGKEIFYSNNHWNFKPGYHETLIR